MDNVRNMTHSPDDNTSDNHTASSNVGDHDSVAATPIVLHNLQPNYVDDDHHLNTKHFNILSWNIGGLMANSAELLKTLEKNQYDIVALQEIKVSYQQLNKIKLPGYFTFALSSSRAKNNQGLLIAVKNTLPAAYKLRSDNTSPFEKLAVRIETPQGNMDIVNYYLSPSKTGDFQFKSHIHPNNPNTIFCGDFNVNHPM